GEDGAEDAFCGGSAIYLDKNTPNASVTKWGLFDRASMSLSADNNPKAMWRFVPVEGTEYYAIQNMYNGYYLGDFAGNNINLPISEKPVAYDVAYVGNAKFNLIPKTRANKENYVLWPEGYEADVVCHVADNAAAWTFVEVVPEEQESIVLSDFAFNLLDVMTVPYNIRDIAEYNEDVHTYAIKKVTQEENGEGELITTIEFYEKNEFAAGEPCLIVLGDTAKDSKFEDYDMVIPFPTEFVEDAHGHEFVSNGIVGGLHSYAAAEGTAISSGKNFFAVDAKGNAYGAQTGIFDLSTYKRAIEDQETAYTLVIPGMAKMTAAADVDADGNINTADVVAVYAFIIQGEASGFTAKAADVNGDGDVNSADVVAIYTAIVGPDGAGSPIFKAQMLKN
ncbi:MAG: dockerin type I repeat-containing protein, partial [Bacteroidaceae bacterium]|nr:dockerin type I repeat-containing protein [Bacteroidaceae bacterium]